MKNLKLVLQNHAFQMRDFVFDLLFPIECFGCGQEKEWLCKKCFRDLNFKTEQYCLRCYDKNNFGEFCSNCQQYFSLNGVFIAHEYENKIIAKLIKSLKYNFAKDISKPLGNQLILFVQNLLNQARLKDSPPKVLVDFKNALLLPVPLHKKRFNWRGFNQAELLAQEVVKNFGLEFDNQNLIRKVYRKPQAKLNGPKRVENIKGCFAWVGNDLKKRNIILIDDITTTGSTLNEAARVLKENNASEVWGLVVAKG